MGKKWYVVHTYSGFENKAKKSLEDKIKLEGLQEDFGEILVPTEQVVEMRDGQKRTTQRKTMPGLHPGADGDERPRQEPGEEHAQGDGLPGRAGATTTRRP